MSLGSQQEADEIFAYVLEFLAWKEMHDSNRNAFAEWEWHASQIRRFEQDNGEGWYRHPGEFVGHYAYGPEMEEPKVPDGWRFLAAGISRRAYLSPTGVVYKVQRDPASTYQGNKGEHETAQKIRKSCDVKGAYIPLTELYKVPGSWVIALEFMDGVRSAPQWEHCTYNNYYGRKCTCMFPGSVRCAGKIRKELTRLGLSDLHSENVLWVPKQRVWAVVDLGLVGGW